VLFLVLYLCCTQDVPKQTPCQTEPDIIQGWNHQCLDFRKLKQAMIGATTAERGSGNVGLGAIVDAIGGNTSTT
jgi:hypothetical protein